MNIIDYIKGKVRGQDANEFEKDSQTDPFLSDAIEGYNSIDGNHVENVYSLKDKISKSGYKRKRKRLNLIHILIIFFLLLISVVSIWVLEDKSQQKFALTKSYYIDSIYYNVNQNQIDFTSSMPEKGTRAYNSYLWDGITVFLESRGKVMGGSVELLFEVNSDGIPYDIELTHGVYKELDTYVIELLKRGDRWTVSGTPSKLKIVFK